MIGDRLREERARMKLSQPAMGELVGAAKRTVIDWEKGRSAPAAAQMAALSDAGFDVLYILTGQRSLPGGAREDAHMLRETHIREPGGDGFYHRLLRDTMQRKAEDSARRESRLAPIVEWLAACSDADFALVEDLVMRMFGRTPTARVGVDPKRGD